MPTSSVIRNSLAPLRFYIVVEMSSKQNNLVILRFLGFDNVADIEELVVPGVQRVNEKSWSSIRSGTTPLVIAATSFGRSATNGTMLRSIVLPLAFS